MMRGNFYPHDFDDEGICRHCDFDGAEAHWLRFCLRAEIGDDEFKYRMAAGDFDDEIYCPKRPIRESDHA